MKQNKDEEFKMTREEAIKYLERKDKLGEAKYSKKDEKEIRWVMQEGKIYGDPLCTFSGS